MTAFRNARPIDLVFMVVFYVAFLACLGVGSWLYRYGNHSLVVVGAWTASTVVAFVGFVRTSMQVHRFSCAGCVGTVGERS